MTKLSKIGGLERARTARDSIKNIFSDKKHPLYFSKDINFARRYSVSRHTIYKIREDLNIPPRSHRILEAIKSLDHKNMTLKELSEALNIKYQNLYKIIKDNNLEFKAEKVHK